MALQAVLPPGVELRPLRWPGTAEPDESLLGLVTRRGAEHFLGSNRIILKGCGIDVRHQGDAVVHATREDMRKLSRILRIDEEHIRKKVCAVIGEDHTGKLVEWGGRSMRLRDLETRFRRISPTSMVDSPHHRQPWLLRLLPYCPISFERLIDTCPSCGSSLRWSAAKPMAWCDQTGCENGDRPIPPTADFLSEEIRREYGLFADLVCSHREKADRARASLHHDLQTIDNPTLVDLILLMSDIDRPATSKASMSISRRTDAAELAERIAKGTRAVAAWPEPLERMTRRAIHNKKSEYHLWLRLKNAASHHPNPGLRGLLVAGVPTLNDCRRTAAPPNSSPIMLQTELVKRTSISAEQGTLLSKGDYLRRDDREGDPGSSKFDLELAEDFIEQWKASSRNNVVANRLKLPVYAVHQCAMAGLLERPSNKGVRAIEPDGRIMNASLTALEVILDTLPVVGPDGGDLISLAVASKIIGGGLKPWAAIIQLVTDGTLECHRARDEKRPTVKSLLLKRDDVSVLGQLSATQSDYHLSQISVSKEDVKEILNARSKQIDELEATGQLSFAHDGRKLACQLSQVLTVAENRIFGAELSIRTGIYPNKLAEKLLAMGINALPNGGWARAETLRALGPSKSQFSEF